MQPYPVLTNKNQIVPFCQLIRFLLQHTSDFGYHFSGAQIAAQIAREWKTAPLAKLCENENQTLEAFVVASRLYAKFDCAVA